MKKIYAVALVCVSLFLPSCEIDGGIVNEGNIDIPGTPPVPKYAGIETIRFYVTEWSQDKLPELQDSGFKAVLEYAPAGSSGKDLKTFEYEAAEIEINKAYDFPKGVDIYSVDWERGSSSGWWAHVWEPPKGSKTLIILVERYVYYANEATFTGITTIVISEQAGASGKTVEIEYEPSPGNQRQSSLMLNLTEAGIYNFNSDPYPNGIDIYDLVKVLPKWGGEIVYWSVNRDTKVLTVMAIQPIGTPDPPGWGIEEDGQRISFIAN